MHLPSHWHWSTLGTVARWGSGGTPKARDPRFYGGSIPWAVIGDLTDGPVAQTAESITEVGLRNSSAKLVPPGAVLVAMYGSIGKLGLTSVELTTNQAIAFAVVHAPVIETKYLFYYLLSQRDQLGAAGKGAAQLNIGQGVLKAWPIPLPSLTEQRRIVELLEDHLSRLGAAARSLDVVAYRSRSLLLSQLAREFRPSSGAESTLGAVADWGSGGTPKARTPTFYEGGEIPWVVSGELKDDVLTEVAGRITQEGLKESSAKWVPAGALLVAMYGATIGRLALTTEPVTTRQAVAHALPHQDVVTAEYMFWFLLSQRRLLVAAGQGGAQPNISQTVLKAWPIRIPALCVQAKAVLAAHSLRDSTRRIQSSAQALHARQGLLRGALLSAAFTGRLTGRAADDEVVEELANV